MNAPLELDRMNSIDLINSIQNELFDIYNKINGAWWESIIEHIKEKWFIISTVQPSPEWELKIINSAFSMGLKFKIMWPKFVPCFDSSLLLVSAKLVKNIHNQIKIFLWEDVEVKEKITEITSYSEAESVVLGKLEEQITEAEESLEKSLSDFTYSNVEPIYDFFRLIWLLDKSHPLQLDYKEKGNKFKIIEKLIQTFDARNFSNWLNVMIKVIDQIDCKDLNINDWSSKETQIWIASLCRKEQISSEIERLIWELMIRLKIITNT